MCIQYDKTKIVYLNILNYISNFIGNKSNIIIIICITTVENNKKDI